MIKPFLLMFLGLLLSVVAPGPVYSANPYHPGFRTLGAWSEDLRLDLSIWYPCTRAPRNLSYPPWTISASRNARPAQGSFPLLILSHPTQAGRFSYHELAAELAGRGYVVVAPVHGHDNMNNMDDLFTWGQLERRVREIAAAFQLVTTDSMLGPQIDSNRTGIIGFGSGGTAALLMGGALPDCQNWYDDGGYCRRASASDPYCSPFARDKINALCQALPLESSMANTRIKAIAAIAPGYAMLFNNQSFTYFYPPLLLVTTGRDHFNDVRLHGEVFARLLGPKARYMELAHADAESLMSSCPPALQWELPELCFSVSDEDRAKYRSRLVDTLEGFFAYYLLDDANLPVIPSPPDLRPKEEKSPDAITEKPAINRGKSAKGNNR